MSFIEGYPELNYGVYAHMDGSMSMPQPPEPIKADKTEKEQRSLFALETQLQKTKLCRYHMKGLCKHGSDCRFAHGKDEMVQPPNLQKTRMCPALLNGEVCNNENCTFAHHESELKKVNICHKTAICTWFLAGKCRNGEECDFAHGEHELKGNAATVNAARTKAAEQSGQQEQSPQASDNSKYQRKEPMFVQSSMSAAATDAVPAQVPPQYQAPNPAQFNVEQLQQQFMPPVVPPPPPPPPGFMPGFLPGMTPCMAGYPATQQDFMQDPAMQLNYMQHAMQGMQGMQPPMQQFPGVEPVGSLPPGLPVGAVVVPTQAPQSPLHQGIQNAQKSWQLTELAVQINMLSEEVKRLQEATIRSAQYQGSTNSGSSTRSSSGDNRTPRVGGVDHQSGAGASSSTGGSSSSTGVPDLDACRSFEEKVQHLQNELKRVMDEGQRCGKIRETVGQTNVL
eukprot:gnl/MRDRNA2_/MRDRNA2_61768_c0_seq1.p1 gnl/MRDRNA2_/MRDRNA2_61768_c0~~gnl/MRDRNA2_/MRDRNA2_61768_c0_seq1.p1  ORF type:complete len:451 (-),score=93.40 gnl/MRDRNA2_/MRDRNA2_61768_c0_seq1:235-1587(-)